MAWGIVLFCYAVEVTVNMFKLGAFDLFKIWEMEIFTVFDGADSPNLEPRMDESF